MKKVLSVLVKSNYNLIPKQKHYDQLKVDEFWTYVGNKSNKIWLVYAYHRVSGEIAAYVRRKRNYKPAR